jgi:hypothetical protein
MHRHKPDNLGTIYQFFAARQMAPLSSLFRLKPSDIYRQTLLDNLGLIAFAVFRKL